VTGIAGVRRQHPRRLFADRREAGQVLAGLLVTYRGKPDVVVLGLARGGLPVAFEVPAPCRYRWTPSSSANSARRGMRSSPSERWPAAGGW